MAVNGLDVAGKLISLIIALMHERPIANLMAHSHWVIEAGLIGRIDWRPSDKRRVREDRIYWSEESTFCGKCHKLNSALNNTARFLTKCNKLNDSIVDYMLL